MDIKTLKNFKQWICWNYKTIEDGKRTKIPVSYLGTKTGTNEIYVNTWGTFNDAKKAVSTNNYSGIGLILTNSICGIDIDHKDLEDGVAKDIINLMNTYTEISPSGEGFHLLFTVDENKLPTYIDEKGKKRLNSKYYQKNSKLDIECYISSLTNRYFTFTGNTVNNKPINERTEELIQFLNKYMQKNNPVQGEKQNNIDVQKIIEIIMKSKQAEKFTKLFYKGDLSNYKSHSEGDLALCSIISFYTQDFYLIDEIFKRSKLYREKWNRLDYKENTINQAIKDKGTYIDNITENSNELEYITARDLQRKELKPITYYVKDILPQGLTLICSAPKIGKSWLALDLCISICNGSLFLGHNTKESGCLYLALEDSKNRLKVRMNKLLGNKEAPVNLLYSTNCEDLANGFIEQLEKILQKNPFIEVIVIDTLQKIRSMSNNTSIYAQDYKELSEIKKFADNHNLAVVVIHHTRKGNDITDIFEKVSGTNGITGTADTTWIINKKDRFKSETNLSMVGRDIEANEYIIEFDKDSCKWNFISTMENFEVQKEKEEYDNNSLVDVIKTLINENNGSWAGTITSMNSKHEELYHVQYEKSPQKFRNKLDKLAPFLWNFDKIEYIPPKNPSKEGRMHTFKIFI